MTTQSKQLNRLFSRLPDEEKKTLLAFAEFLVSRSGLEEEPVSSEPNYIPRPEKETVIGAIRRLSKTYPMLDKATMLNETSSLMGEHVLHGQSAPDVIDKLEVVFQRHYEEMKSSQPNPPDQK